MNMDKCNIVRRAEELKAVGASVLEAAFSLEVVTRVLAGVGKRKRTFDARTTWLTFLGQCLASDHSCRNALALARAAGLVDKETSVHTGGYCTARGRLKEEPLHRLAAALGAELSEQETAVSRWHRHRVLVADGSTVSMPDTRKNQAAYPQPSAQAEGCGFPVMYFCALMSLGSGALLDFAVGNEADGELTLWRRLWDLLRPGDIVLGDRAYCSYADIALLRARGVDVVARLGRRKTDFRKGRLVGVEDHIVCWTAPKQLPDWLGTQTIPATLTLREIRFHVEIPGCRVETITLVTTLLDVALYPKEDLADLFFDRWQIELRLRDIKTLLGMDILRTKTPDRVRKELWMFLAAYNLLRTLMYSAAQKAQVSVARISFQGCRQRLLAARILSGPPRIFFSEYRRLLREVGADCNPDRPFRVEPRARKRRPKQYDLLNKPRAVWKREHGVVAA